MLEIDNSKNPVIIFDTNFLLLPEQFKIDIFENSKNLLANKETIFIIFDKTIEELKELSKSKKKHSVASKIGLKLIKKLEESEEIIIIKTNEKSNYVDKLIINYDKYIKVKEKSNLYIATQDKELKNEIKKKKVKIVFLAQRNILKVM